MILRHIKTGKEIEVMAGTKYPDTYEEVKPNKPETKKETKKPEPKKTK